MPEQTRRLLLDALAGDARSRTDLLDRLRARVVLWTATRLSPALRAKIEPEDLAQDVLLQVHEGLDRFEGRDDRAFLGWVFTIAENRIRDCADHFGALKRQERDVPAKERTTPPQRAIRNEMAARVREALRRLDEPYRQVIQLRRFEERDTDEVAAILDRSPNAVRILYCRAIKALRDELGPLG